MVRIAQQSISVSSPSPSPLGAARVPQLKNTPVVPIGGVGALGSVMRSTEAEKRLHSQLRNTTLMTAIIAKLHVEVKLARFEELDDLLQCVFIFATDSN